MTTQGDMEAAFEALLFASSDLLSRAQLLALFENDAAAQGEEALDAVLGRQDVQIDHLEAGDDPPLALVDDLEVGGGQPPHRIAVASHDADRNLDSDDPRLALEGLRRLLGDGGWRRDGDPEADGGEAHEEGSR